MAYYKNEWNPFSEEDRRAFGQRMRAAASKEWHQKWFSKTGLKTRLWTDKAIAQFLPKPVDAGPVKAWPREDVLAIEKTPAFKAWMAKRKEWLAAREKPQ